MKKIKVLHLLGHLGGGVGRVLTQVAKFRLLNESRFEDSFICFEKPEKPEIISGLRNLGISVYVCPEKAEEKTLISEADIIQIEWWNHPSLAKWMLENSITSRLIVWCHVSGLHYPYIPEKFIDLPHVFMFTSSLSRPLEGHNNIIKIVNSSGGFDDFPVFSRSYDTYPLRYSYIGSFNKSKLHPNIKGFLESAPIPGFFVNFFGDEGCNPDLRNQSKSIRVCGFTDSPYEVLKNTDVFVYLLNPNHYGTTENSLLEAMAMGAVPIVLNNPVEFSIVDNGVNGVIVSSEREFARAIMSLEENRGKRIEMSVKAMISTRKIFSLRNTVGSLDNVYDNIMIFGKKLFEFNSSFGKTPSEVFHSCLGKYNHVLDLPSERIKHSILYEESKGSVFQFLRYFPDDLSLNEIASTLRKDLENGK